MLEFSERGKVHPCPWCGIKNANQHSLRESGRCDGVRNFVAGDLKLEDVRDPQIPVLAKQWRNMKLGEAA